MTADPELVPVAQLRELLAKAVPQEGRWYASPWHIEEGEPAVRVDGYGIVCNCASDTQAKLIAAMHEALPALLDELDALRALRARVEELAGDFQGCGDHSRHKQAAEAWHYCAGKLREPCLLAAPAGGEG